MEKIRYTRIPMYIIYMLIFLAGGLSRTIKGIPSSSFSAFLYCILIAIWFHDIRRRVLDDTIDRIMIAISSFLFYLMIARTIKYNLVSEIMYLDSLTWYLPCIGVIAIATLLVFLAFEIGAPDTKGLKKHHFLAIPGTIIGILILTNDFHHLCYTSAPSNDSGHGIVYYIYMIWVILLFVSSLVIMIGKCSVNLGKKYAFIPTGVLILAYAFILTVTGFFDKVAYRPLFKYGWYETLVIMVIAYIESCIAIGLIPSKNGFDELFRKSSIAVEIKDDYGNTVIHSSERPDTGDDRNIVRKRAIIPGGYIYWNDDITDINKIIESILHSANELSEEQELIKAEKELIEAREKYTLRSTVYDGVTASVDSQVKHIEQILNNEHPDLQELVVYGVYIKRKANLVITSADTDTLSIGELYLSLKDALDYLKYSDISTEIKANVKDLSLQFPASMVISIFDEYEKYVENNLRTLKSLKISVAPDRGPKIYIDAVNGRKTESYVLS
ncbi:MAG: hypothetical protein IJ757_05520 [Clostridiales bacterium]|nr:hypothetical protein [Clostridiales bacterium]